MDSLSGIDSGPCLFALLLIVSHVTFFFNFCGVGCISCWRASPETKQSDVVFVDRDEDVTSAVIGWKSRTRFRVALTDVHPYDKTPRQRNQYPASASLGASSK